MSDAERFPLAHLPTPLELLPALSRRVGATVVVKRDDATGLAMGGNKARKLERYVAAARAEGADELITFGGVQSNHCRSTAAAAARAGMTCTLLLAGPPPPEADGNLLLDLLLGASTRFLGLGPAELTPDRVEEAYADAEASARARGRRPFRIPPGGSGAHGVIAYAGAFEEMRRQAAASEIEIGEIVVAFGTGGTLAGILLGSLLAGGTDRVIGVSVAPPGMPASLGVPDPGTLVREGAGHLRSRGGPAVDPGAMEIRIEYGWSGRAYGAPTPEANAAIRTLAREEGLLLDPVYTAKAMAALLDLAARREIGRRGAILFWHTGGTPALFPYRDSLLGDS